MTQLLYDIVTTLAAPIGAAWLALVPKRRALLGRFKAPLANPADSPIWVHACSVGELSVARPLLAGLRRRLPDQALLLTVSTQAAHAMATDPAIPASLAWYPVDQRHIVKRFFDATHPRMLLLMETEIWPNVLREANERGVPALVLNARISDKHFARYQRRKCFFQSVFSRLNGVGAQHPLYAQRFTELGVPPERVAITGNVKFDNLTTSVDPARTDELRAACGIAKDALVLVFGSTRPGDEQLAAQCWPKWKAAFPSAHLVIAPRHRERLQESLAPFSEPVLLRSAVQKGQAPAGERIVLVDTLGELVNFYALATVAIVGGSFYPGVNGHNPLEPAALGAPTVFGPFMRNFLDPAEVLVSGKGAVQVSQPEALCDAVAALLRDGERRLAMAENAANAIAKNTGALERTLDLVCDMLLKSEAST